MVRIENQLSYSRPKPQRTPRRRKVRKEIQNLKSLRPLHRTLRALRLNLQGIGFKSNVN